VVFIINDIDLLEHIANPRESESSTTLPRMLKPFQKQVLYSPENAPKCKKEPIQLPKYRPLNSGI
jgi:hypothetical protein